MGKTIRASVLVLLLACSAQAGWIQNGSPTTPPPPPGAEQEPTGGEMQNGYMPNDVTDSLTQAALDLLALLL
jgi:hypothetical protein